MKASTPPVLCGIALTAMAAAGMSHWWSVRQMVDARLLNRRDNVPASEPASLVSQESATEKPATTSQIAATVPMTSASNTPASEEFFQSLIGEIRELRNQNRDLRDQIAETNRDVMKLEFRVDTHSESFRPLPVSEDRFDTTFESDAGILPPRALPVESLNHP